MNILILQMAKLTPISHTLLTAGLPSRVICDGAWTKKATQITDHHFCSHLDVKEQETEIMETYSFQSVVHNCREHLAVPLIAAQWSLKLVVLGKTTKTYKEYLLPSKWS